MLLHSLLLGEAPMIIDRLSPEELRDLARDYRARARLGLDAGIRREVLAVATEYEKLADEITATRSAFQV